MEGADKGQCKDSKGTGADVMETCFNYCSADKAYFSSDERRWINRVRKLKENNPDQIRIIAEPDENDGCIYCELPIRYLHVFAPSKRELTEEQKEEMRERGKNLQNKRKTFE